MEYQADCPTCYNSCSVLETHCHHCYTQFLGTPNVRLAQLPHQVAALESRYTQAKQLAAKLRNEDAVAAFEAAIEARSHAVASYGYAELRYLAENDRRVFATFYQRVEAGLQIPTGGKWDALRGIAEHALYQHQKKEIHFAALSLNHIGAMNYGECHVTFRQNMIKERTSTFEDNNVVFTVYTQQTTMAEGEQLSLGHVSDWRNRHKLAIAKHAREVSSSPLDDAQRAMVLIKQGRTTADDRFIELHIWGSITIRVVEKVVILPRKVGRSLQKLRYKVLGIYWPTTMWR